jgi:hypothetical protein
MRNKKKKKIKSKSKSKERDLFRLIPSVNITFFWPEVPSLSAALNLKEGSGRYFLYRVRAFDGRIKKIKIKSEEKCEFDRRTEEHGAAGANNS